MKIIICNDEAVEQYRKKTRKGKAPVVLGIIGIVLLACVAVVSVLGNWTAVIVLPVSAAALIGILIGIRAVNNKKA